MDFPSVFWSMLLCHDAEPKWTHPYPSIVFRFTAVHPVLHDRGLVYGTSNFTKLRENPKYTLDLCSHFSRCRDSMCQLLHQLQIQTLMMHIHVPDLYLQASSQKCIILSSVQLVYNKTLGACLLQLENYRNCHLSSIRESNFCLERLEIRAPIPTLISAWSCLVEYSWSKTSVVYEITMKVVRKALIVPHKCSLGRQLDHKNLILQTFQLDEMENLVDGIDVPILRIRASIVYLESTFYH